MRILVTGATGFVGSNIVIELDRIGHEVIAIGAEKEQELDGFSGRLVLKNFYDLDWDKDVSGKIDAVFHEAAITGMLSRSGNVFDNQKEFMRVNCHEAIDLFEKVVERGCKKIVYASTTAVYGNSPAPYVEGKSEKPNSYYGESKLALDKKAMKFASKKRKVNVVGLRYCNVYGPRENHKGRSANYIYQIAKQMVKGNPKLFKHGEQKRDEIYIKDIVRANLMALKSNESCVVNCGTGNAVSFNFIIKVLNSMMRLNREIIYINNPYKFFQDFTECDMTLAKEKLGFKAEWGLEEGIRDYFESGWLTKQWKNKNRN